MQVAPRGTLATGQPPGTTTWRNGCLALVILTCILVALFHRSFRPEEVLFANDAPLGALRAYEPYVLDQFTGSWYTLNWIGQRGVEALISIPACFYILLGSLGFAKYYAAASLLILGLSAWLFFRQLRFSPLACLLGAVATTLNTDSFSYACWGLPPVPLTMATSFLALAVLMAPPTYSLALKASLAGLAVGMGVVQSYDVGALYSLYIAAFVVFLILVDNGKSLGKRWVRAVATVALVAGFAAFISIQTLPSLVATQISGVAGTRQDNKTKEQRWDEATLWSLPKLETLRVIIPGLLGYRMDTPDGRNYWGAVGQTPGWPEHHMGQARHSGSGVYAGVLVVLTAAWSVANARRKKDSPFTDRERRFIWFWTAVALISLLLAYGRHAPLYQLFYALPYTSTIRNPIKFMHQFSWAIAILCAYGIEGLRRSYLPGRALKSSGLWAHWKAWWPGAPAFERKWVKATAAIWGAAVLGWLLYASSKSELMAHMQRVGFPGELANLMSRASVMEVGWFVLFFGLSAVCLAVILSGALSGPRARWAAALLGLLLVADLVRANLPWIVYYNYKERYATNPVFEFLRSKPYEHRTATRIAPLAGSYLVAGEEAQNVFRQLVDAEWLQQQYQYYRIQSIDIIQMPRMPELDSSFLHAMAPTGPSDLFRVGRLWQLTNTRYILGMKGFLDLINQQIDPTNHSFRVRSTFDFAQKGDQITAVERPEGQFAVFEFGAALPRAKLYSHWQVATNDESVLQTLTNPAFDPQTIVLVDQAVPGAPAPSQGTASTDSATISEYIPTHVGLNTTATSPTVLLLNDRFEPNWKVTVDGKPQPLLRCNYIMRGVYLPPGNHRVDFRLDPPHWTFYVSLMALAVGVGLCGLLAFGPKPMEPSESLREVEPQPAVTPNLKSKI